MVRDVLPGNHSVTNPRLQGYCTILLQGVALAAAHSGRLCPRAATVVCVCVWGVGLAWLPLRHRSAAVTEALKAAWRATKQN